MAISAQTCARSVIDVLERVASQSGPQADAAARLVADCLRADGVVHAFGTGHSQATALEIAGRAGGLIPTNRIALADLVVYGGEDPTVLADPLLERRPDTARRLYELAAPRPQDLFVIVSNSGVNAGIVEMARLVTSRGHKLIALTSLRHTHAVPPTHESGKRLLDFADVTLDNGAPVGDAVLEIGDGTTACGVSALTGALLVQMMIAQTIALLVADGIQPPVYLSANLPGGHERNIVLEQRLAGRIRRTAA